VTVFIPKIIYFNLNITKTLQSVIFSSLKCQEYQEVLHHIAIQERKDEQKKKELDRFFPPHALETLTMSSSSVLPLQNI
jgi:hypothetical protein